MTWQSRNRLSFWPQNSRLFRNSSKTRNNPSSLESQEVNLFQKLKRVLNKMIKLQILKILLKSKRKYSSKKMNNLTAFMMMEASSLLCKWMMSTPVLNQWMRKPSILIKREDNKTRPNNAKKIQRGQIPFTVSQTAQNQSMNRKNNTNRKAKSSAFLTTWSKKVKFLRLKWARSYQ